MTRVYDIRDLVTGDPAARDELVENILDIIRTTIDRDSWVQGGGLVGSVKELGGQIVVTQTAENHRELAALLKALRGQTPTVPQLPETGGK